MTTIQGIRMANGSLAKIRDVGENSIWSSIKLRENAFAVAEGRSADHAFRRGRQGKGIPLWACAPSTPIFEHLFHKTKDEWEHPERAHGGREPVPVIRRRWVSSLFLEHYGWAMADAESIVVRFAEATSEHAQSTPEDGIRGPNWALGRRLDQMLLRALTDPGESLDENQRFGPVGLGEHPEFAAVCVRAVALLALNEAAPPGKLGVLKLPKRRAGGYKRFLFFGYRTVT